MNIVPNAAHNYVFLNTAGLVGGYITTPTINTLSSSDLTLNLQGANINCSSKAITNMKQINVTNPDGFALNILSGSSSQFSAFSIGKSASEMFMTVCNSTSSWSSSAVAGDSILRLDDGSKKICININNESVASLIVKNYNTVPSLSNDDTLNVNGGCKMNEKLYVTGDATAYNFTTYNISASSDVASNSISSNSVSTQIITSLSPTINFSGKIVNNVTISTPTIKDAVLNNPILNYLTLNGVGSMNLSSLTVTFSASLASAKVESGSIAGTSFSVRNHSTGGVEWKLESRGSRQLETGNLYLTNTSTDNLYLDVGGNRVKAYQLINLNYTSNQSFPIAGTMSPYMRFIRDIVNSDGTMTWLEDASQWTSVRNGTRDYTITFIQSFSVYPCVVATPEMNSDTPVNWN